MHPRADGRSPYGLPNQKITAPNSHPSPPWQIDRLVGYMNRSAASVTKYSGLAPLPRQIVAGCGVLPCTTGANPAIRRTDQSSEAEEWVLGLFATAADETACGDAHLVHPCYGAGDSRRSRRFLATPA